MTRRFVRVLGTLPNGLIEFVFAIGDPDVAVELVMPKPAFDEFCRANEVEFLVAEAPAEPQATDADFKWGMHQATHQRFRT
ncbi:MAG TPA: phenol hydroxylase subunit [Burkholderiaceae bacterium]|nr:phenol hydroxylase subunit [Burkholderiaceae bacterium]